MEKETGRIFYVDDRKVVTEIEGFLPNSLEDIGSGEHPDLSVWGQSAIPPGRPVGGRS